MVLDQDREYISAEPPIIILSTKYHEPLGVINGIDKDTISINYNMNSADEISFDVYKRIDDVEEPLWEQIIDFKYIYVPAIQEYFSIEVSIDDSDDTVKHITGTSACEFELSNRYLYGFGVNDDTDWQAQKPQKDEDYIPTLFYRSDPEMKKYSLLDRVLADTNANLSDYSLSHVDASLANIQRKFVVDGQSVYQFLTGSVAKEVECLFVFDSVNRTIGAYDLAYVCENCGYRGEASAKCPKCENTNYIGGEHYSQYYGATIGLGANTSLYISAENYAEQITRNANVDNVFNCLRISGGDDIINTALRYVNPNGSRYLYRYNEDMLSDMPEELKLALQSYSDDYEDALESYAVLSNAYYAAVDQKNFLEHTMMPTVTTPTTDAQTEANKLPTSFANFGNVYVTNIRTLSNSSANLAVQGLAKVLADARYDVKAEGSVGSVTEDIYRTWTGTIKVTNFGDSEDTATTVQFSVTIELAGDDNPSAYPDYLYQRILKQIERDDNTFKSIFEITDMNMFKQALKEYGLASLKSFYQTYDTILSILVESKAGDPNYDFHGLQPTLYESMYEPYRNRQIEVEKEMRVREGQIYGLDEDKVGDAKSPYQYADSTHTTESQQWIINQLTNQMQTEYWDEFNFRNYLETKYPGQGERLWRIYCHYRLESTYSNSNYISTGLENPQIIKNAQELFEVARREVVKASEPVYTLSTNLNDLLLDTEEYRNTSVKEARFSDVFRDKFKLGNWLAMQSDDEVFYLRLIALSVDYGSPENINVTFSEASKLSSIISDAQTVLDQAKNMAASYDSVVHQASQGEEAERSVTSWMQDGLNAALTKIKSNTNEEITYDKNGLHARSYDDIEEAYNDKQLRITHNVIAFTSDNWRTVRMVMGESLYAKYSEQADRVTTDNPGYGVLAEYLNGSYITGSQIVGGDLYSLNYSATNHVGSHIDLNTGYFSLAGGKIKYDNEGFYIEVSDSYAKKSEAIKSDKLHYMASSYDSGVEVRPDGQSTIWGTWTSSIQNMSVEKKYLWIYHEYTYADDTHNNSVPVIYGVYGDTGLFSVDMNDGQWVRTDDKINGGVIYKSDSNYHVASTNAVCTITINGLSSFTLMCKNSGEQNCDYMLIGNLDTTVSTSNYHAKIDNGPSMSTYQAVTFSNIDGGIHTIQVMYRKDGSVDQGEDRAFFYVEDILDATGTPGADGEQGVGIADVQPLYYVSNSSTAPAKPTSVISTTASVYGQWSRTMAELTDTYCYLFTCDQILYDNTSVGNNGYKWTDVCTDQAVIKLGSDLRMMKNKTVLSVNNGRLVTMTLEADATQSSFSVAADDIAFVASGNIQLNSQTVGINSDNFKVSTTGVLTATAGTIGGWSINRDSIYSNVTGSSPTGSYQIVGYDYGGGAEQTTGFPWEYYKTLTGTDGTYEVWRSTNNATGNTNKYTYSRCRINFSGYSKFVIGAFSSGEATYDYVSVGQIDMPNITSDRNASPPTTELKYHFKNNNGSSSNVDNVDAYTTEPLVFENLDGGSHFIEVVYYKDQSGSTEPDRGYVFVKHDECVVSVGSNTFALSTKDFSRSIGTTSLSTLRMAVGNNFGITNNGTIYASNAQLSGTVKTGSGTQYTEMSNGLLKFATDAKIQMIASSSYTSSTYDVIKFTNNGTYANPVPATTVYGSPLNLRGGTDNSGGTVNIGGSNVNISTSGSIDLTSATSYYYLRNLNTSGTKLITINSSGKLDTTNLPGNGNVRYAKLSNNTIVDSSVKSVLYKQLSAGNWIVFGFIQLNSGATSTTSTNVPDVYSLQAGLCSYSSSSTPSTTVMQAALSTKVGGPTDKIFVVSHFELSSTSYIHLVAMQNSSTTTYAAGTSYLANNESPTSIYAVRISDYSAESTGT